MRVNAISFEMATVNYNTLERVSVELRFGWRSALYSTGYYPELIGEFDPGSERTLAACLTHASRTLFIEWRTGE